MPAQKPEDCDYLVAEYINSGNVQAAPKLGTTLSEAAVASAPGAPGAAGGDESS